MPAAYIIVDMKISDPEQYKHYMAVAPDAVKASPIPPRPSISLTL